MPSTQETMTVSDGVFSLDHTTAASGDWKTLLKTENTFVDKDIGITITTPAAASPTLAANDLTGAISMGTATSGVYHPTATITGNVNVSTAGWIASGNHSVSDTGVALGTVNQSTLKNGTTTIASGSTITPGASSQTINIGEGYNAARTVIVGAASSGTAASAPSLSVDDITGSITMGTASNGVYSPTATITGDVTIATAGYIAADDYAVSDTGVKIGTVNQSTLKNGNTTIASGTTVNPAASAQTINITEGYNTARTVVIGAASAGPSGTITSGSGEVDSVTVAYNSTNSNFDVTGSADVSAPTVGTAGYVSSTIGTKNANTGGATVAATLPKIGIQANLSGTGTKTPSIAKDSNTNIAQAGTATTTQPSSGYYVAVKSAANTGTVTATATVATAGYGTTTSGQYTTTDSSALTVGANASSVTYIPITQATYANTASSGVTYTDISSSAPALISGSYLFINAGYAPNQKISLAKLVPDATGANASSDKILSGFTAYDNDGALITGNIPTYTGLYEVV